MKCAINGGSPVDALLCTLKSSSPPPPMYREVQPTTTCAAPPAHPPPYFPHLSCSQKPHQDGPLYHPGVAILSLGSPAVLRFWRKQEEGAGIAAVMPNKACACCTGSLLSPLNPEPCHLPALHGGLGGTGGLPPVASVLLMPRSLLLFSDEAYEDCLHGIDEARPLRMCLWLFVPAIGPCNTYVNIFTINKSNNC